MVRVLICVSLLALVGGASVLAEVQTPSCTTALLIIDVQSAWLSSRSVTIDHVPVQVKTAELADAARAAGVPVVFVKDVAYRERFGDALLGFAPPLEVRDGDVVVEKTHPNGFLDTPLEQVLRDLGATTLLISGYASSECVQETVRGGYSLGFEIIIIEDGHSSGQGGYMAGTMNAVWRRQGLQVLASTEIDFATLCAPSDLQVEEENGG
jgi:nicotinamidase-related amidase